jgi:hypothetical protein
MRISDDRYSRDRSRFDIAVQFIRHEARTHTIRDWTGLSDFAALSVPVIVTPGS